MQYYGIDLDITNFMLGVTCARAGRPGMRPGDVVPEALQLRVTAPSSAVVPHSQPRAVHVQGKETLRVSGQQFKPSSALFWDIHTQGLKTLLESF